MSVVLYFGCVGTTGHRLVRPDYSNAFLSVQPWGNAIDSTLCPGEVDRRSGQVRTEHQIEGVARLTHEHGWTALSFWDRSVDHRGGSHSTFVAPGEYAFHAMVDMARAAFPRVWARYTFPVAPEPRP